MRTGVGPVGGMEGIVTDPVGSEHRRVEGMHGQKTADGDGS